MKNSKKIVVALGWALAIVSSGVSQNILAMEQPCNNISQEIKELHSAIVEEGKGTTSDNSGLILYNFLSKDSDIMLIHLLNLIKRLEQRLEQIRKDSQGLGEAPGVIYKSYLREYTASLSILPKTKKLLDLIKSACGTTDSQMNEIKNRVKK